MKLSEINDLGEIVECLTNIFDYNMHIEISKKNDELTWGPAECYSGILQCGEPAEKYDIDELIQCGSDEVQGDELKEWAEGLGLEHLIKTIF